MRLTSGEELPVHPEYRYLMSCYKFWKLSYEGGPRYKTGKDCDGQPVLIPHENETSDATKRRCCAATYRNYCKQVVAKYNKFIFNTNIVREDVFEPFTQWFDNVDMLGNDLHDFMKSRSREAQIYGKSFVGIDSTKSEENRTAAAAAAMGDQLFLFAISPFNVVDWRYENGVLLECTVLFPGGGVRHYAPDEIQIGTVDDENVVTVRDTVPNPFAPFLPVVPVFFSEDGESQLTDIAECNKALFNLDGILMEELRTHTFTTFMVNIPGFMPSQLDKGNEHGQGINNVKIGGRNMIVTNVEEGTVEPHKLSSDVSQADSIRETMDGFTKEIWRLAGLKDPDVLQNAESGRALKIKMAEVESIAASIADEAERAENKLINLWTKGMGIAQEVRYTDYPEEFDVSDLVVELESTLKVLNSSLPKVLKRQQVQQYAKAKYPKMTPEERQELVEELDNIDEGVDNLFEPLAIEPEERQQ